MMPAHFALSDAAIVLVSIWAGMALWRGGQWLPAIAMASFGFPAAVGVVRLGGGLQSELGVFHAGTSQLLGLVGAITLAAACISRKIRWDHKWVTGAIVMIACAVFFLAKWLLAPFFIFALLIAFGATLRDAVQIRSSALVPSGILVLMVMAECCCSVARISCADCACFGGSGQRSSG
jgi:hypothetical protein